MSTKTSRKLPGKDAATDLGDAVRRVIRRHERVLLTDDRGLPVVVLIPISDLDHFRRHPLIATPVTWRGRKIAALVSLEELARLERAEDRFDAAAAAEILDDPDQKPIGFDDVLDRRERRRAR